MDERTRNSVGGQARVGTVVQAGSVGELHMHAAPDGDGVLPVHMPPDVRHFENRDDERARVLSAAGSPRSAGRPLVVSVTGVQGVGKTALAVHLAHRLASDGDRVVRYVDLDDHRRDGGVDLTDVLGELLRSFKVTDLLEGTFARRRRQYWEQTGGRRLVLVVDNARFGTEIAPLLPSCAAGLVIVTSQGRLYDVEGGVDLELPVDPLEEAYAERLLHRITGDPRLTADPASAAALARVCGGLPAALEVAATLLRKHETRRISRVITQLTADLEGKGVPMVEAVWDAVYEDLAPDAAALYRLLAAHPGPTVHPDAATALLGRGRDAAEDALGELVRASLLSRGRGGRLRLHDLLRAHAARCARRHDGGTREAAEAGRRVVRWYLRQAQRADALAAGTRMTFAPPVPALPDTPDVDFAAVDFAAGAGDAGRRADEGLVEGTRVKAGAARWLEGERLALFDCVRIARVQGLDEEAWSLCEPLWTHYLDHPHHTQVLEAFEAGRDAALRAGHPLAALVRMRCQLARPLWEQGRHEEAATELRQAAAAAETLGDGARERKLRASVLEFRGMLSSARDDWAAAAADFEASGRIHTEIGNAYGAMLQTYRLGQAVLELGEPDRAATLLARAHAEAHALGRARMTGRTGFELGRALARLGRFDEAATLFDSALAAARQRGSAKEELRTLRALTALAEEAGDAARAREFHARAEEVRVRGGGLQEGTG
ncbi:tetratricopeptide repeat protein [Streptomyces sp. NPDC003032]